MAAVAIAEWRRLPFQVEYALRFGARNQVISSVLKLQESVVGSRGCRCPMGSIEVVKQLTPPQHVCLGMSLRRVERGHPEARRCEAGRGLANHQRRLGRPEKTAAVVLNPENG